MVLKDGNKYACESCIRGHRVSGCNHTDRELHFIAPKGRPVKQCDHCRGARKSKSHHAKCDCGGKKDRGEVKLDDKGCCCALGDNCVCGLKNAPDLRVDTTVSKASHQRPHLTKGTSESHVTTYINEHHKACHKLKHSTQLSGMPYPSRKTNESGASNTPSSIDTQGQFGIMTMIPRHGSKDDSVLMSPSARPYSSSGPTQSLDSLPLGPFAGGSLFASQGYDFMTSTPVEGQDQMTFASNDSCSEQFLNDLFKSNSPVEHTFSPADLPLTSNAFLGNFPQPTSYSEESNTQSAPGLTAASSSTHSEIGDAANLLDSGLDSTFDTPDANAFSATFDMQNMAGFGDASPTLQKPMQAPTSDPTESVCRSLDIDAIPSFPGFDENLQSYLSNSAVLGQNNNQAAAFDNYSESNGLSSLPYDSQEGSTPTPNPAPLSFNPVATTVNFDTMAASPTASTGPRSLPIPISGAATYNPTTNINALYPQLDADFSAAASWDPSAIDIGSSSWQFPVQ